jgi:hypothetical protein
MQMGRQVRSIEPILIERTCLPICMVDSAGDWIRPDLAGNTASGRPLYRSIPGRRAAFLGYDWEALHIPCPVEDRGNGLFSLAPWIAES